MSRSLSPDSLGLRKDERGRTGGVDSPGSGTPHGDSLFHCHMFEYEDMGMMRGWCIQ